MIHKMKNHFSVQTVPCTNHFNVETVLCTVSAPPGARLRFAEDQ